MADDVPTCFVLTQLMVMSRESILVARTSVSQSQIWTEDTARWNVSTRGNRTPDKIVNLIRSGLHHLLQQTGISEKRLLATGLGAPGITDVRAGTVISAPHLQDWQSVPLRNLLESKLKIPTVIENDVNTAALGESWAGSAKGVSNFVFLAIGTGIGAGIYIADHLLSRIRVGCRGSWLPVGSRRACFSYGYRQAGFA